MYLWVCFKEARFKAFYFDILKLYSEAFFYNRNFYFRIFISICAYKIF